MKRYVALDIGNVLCKINLKDFISDISERLNISTLEVSACISRSQRLLDSGLVNMKEILEGEFHIKSSVVVKDLLHSWNMNVLNFDHDMFEFFTEISNNHDLHIALLSNVGFEHTKVIDSYLKMLNTQVWKEAIRYFSCEVGVRKPQSLYYQSFLQRYPKFYGCVYLDDLPDNLIMGSEFGLQSVEFNLDKISSSEERDSMLKQIENMILNPVEKKN